MKSIICLLIATAQAVSVKSLSSACVQANTDGITCMPPKDMLVQDDFDADTWNLDT